MTLDLSADEVERRYRVTHRTEYRYEQPMTDGYTVAHLLPRDTPLQRVEEATVEIEPDPAEYDEFTDVFGNRVTQFGVHRPHDHLVVESRSVVVLTPNTGLGPGEPWEDVAALVRDARDETALAVAPFRASCQLVDLRRFGAELAAIVAPVMVPGRGVIDVARELCHLVHTQFAFDPTSTDVSTPLGEVLANRRGVCQDFAHLTVGCLRAYGLAARYVSGYIETEPPPGQERLVGADASHAWCSVWSPGVGWVDFDPTNDHLPVIRHVTVGWGRDYGDVTPVRGVVIGPSAAQTLAVAVDVAPL